MANPTTITNIPAAIKVTTSQAAVTLNGSRSHTLKHNRVDSSGAASSVTVFLAFDGNVTADYAEGTDKGFVLDGDYLPLPPGIDRIAFKTASGEAMVSILPGRMVTA